MFRIVFNTDDKRLAKALKALVGISIGPPEVSPIINASLANGKLVPAGPIEPAEFFKQFPALFEKRDVMAALAAGGRSKANAQFMLTRGLEAKLIRRKSRGWYTKPTGKAAAK